MPRLPMSASPAHTVARVAQSFWLVISSVAVAMTAPAAIGAPSAGAATAAAQVAAAEADGRELTRATLAFRLASQDGRFADALGPALRIVELTESSQPGSPALGLALTDLGVLQLQLGDPTAAMQSLERAVATLEITDGTDGVNLITPLGGLGMASAAAGNHEQAIRLLDRAVDHPQRRQVTGPRDALSMLDTLVQSHRALGHVEAAERRTVEAYELADGLYPRDDPVRLPRLMDLGRWYEATGRKPLAVPVYRRAVEIAQAAGPGSTAALIDGLRALSRALTRQSVMLGVPLDGRYGWVTRTSSGGIDGDFTEEQLRQAGRLAFTDQFAYLPLALASDEVRPIAAVGGRHNLPDTEGEAAILRAAALARSDPTLSPSVISEALIDAGDWQAIHRRLPRARQLWTEALQLPGEAGAISRQRLDQPRLLSFPLSVPQVENARRRGPKSVKVDGVFSYQVTDEGVVWEIDYSGGQLNTSEIRAARAALATARYAPRFEGTTPVATEGVTFTSTWYRDP